LPYTHQKITTIISCKLEREKRREREREREKEKRYAADNILNEFVFKQASSNGITPRFIQKSKQSKEIKKKRKQNSCRNEKN